MCIYKTDDGKCKKFSDNKTTSWCVDAPCEYEKQSNYDKIRNMSLDEMAEYFAFDKHPNFPSSPCYVCEYDDGLCCTNENGCTDEYKSKVYKDWLESEVDE